MKQQLLFLFIIILIAGCRKDPIAIDTSNSGYPNEIANIILPNCTNEGCHNSQSKDAAAGLDLSTWHSAFEGSNSGSVILAGQPEFSSLFSFINVHSDLGPMSTPTMPYNKPPLSREQIVNIKNWIASGAPNNLGQQRFNDPRLSKYYVTIQGCDKVAVIDRTSKLVIKYVDVGNSAAIESPHSIHVSPDGKHFYVSFINGNSLQKFRTSDDTYVGEVPLTFGSWNSFVITANSSNAFVSDFANNRIVYVDLSTLKVLVTYTGYSNPHGVILSDDGKFLYATAQLSDHIYKIDVSDPFNEIPKQISLQGGTQPHEILFTPDRSKYFVTCQGTGDTRVFKSSDDQYLASIATGINSQEISFSEKYPLGFVSCTEDTITFPGKRGSVAIIDYNSLAVIKSVFTGFQPHGLAVDDQNETVYVVNRNVSSQGPAAHHTTSCGARNGYSTIISLRDLSVDANDRTELLSDPYFVSIKK